MVVGAQNVKIPKDANKFTYWQIEYGERNDTTNIYVHRDGDLITIVTEQPKGKLIPGYAQTVTEVDYAQDSITVSAYYDDSIYFYRTAFSRNNIEWRRDGNKHICSVNSNTLEFEMDERAPVNVTPLPYYGLNKGVLRSFTRNGQKRLVLAKAKKVDWGICRPSSIILPSRRVTPREFDRIMKERLVVTTRVFDRAQLHWGAKNAHFEGSHDRFPSSVLLPFDTLVHYAGGTLVLKRMRLPDLPAHYQHFVELHQQSNGDAYDRTGSVFIIPTDGSVHHNFFDGVNWHPDSLPTFTGRDGQRYQGMMSTRTYQPPVEWMRFFTPFGVGHFNERMAGFGIDWRSETYYRQEITDVYRGGDVIVGAWIGNYDGGGHLITLDIKSYPNDYTTQNSESNIQKSAVPLFNTCNVLEMAGQNYGKLFGTDSLTVTFRIQPRHFTRDTLKSARLRYISTGHGGWGEGDEFVPKQNTILIDGKPTFIHTPWRQDCGCYRDLNPVSGNFWNGLSSSDFSRSGWCPGTATQPVYFDMSPWADGREHTLTVAIQQGKPVEGMFSHWAVSGALVVEY
jgi:hypothetical protein